VLAYGAESIVHGLISAVAVAMLLHWRRQDAPDTRILGMGAALLLPALLTPALRFLVPARLTPAFRDGPALLSASHFLPWRTAGLVALGALAVLGALFFLRDVIPFVRDRRQCRPGAQVSTGPAVQAAVRAAQRLGIPVPPILEERHGHPVLMCRGWRPEIVISTGLVQALTPQELQAAMMHELAHAARRDPLLGWGLMLVRALCFWNPAVQVLGRWMVRELERRADQITADMMDEAGPLVSSLRRIDDMQAGSDSWVRRLARRDIEARCRAVQVPKGSSRQAWPLAFAVGLAIILFLVVV
jgi:Zn-dependent protease with chaperone function